MRSRLLFLLLVAALAGACDRSTGPDTSPLRLPALSVGEVYDPGRPAAEVRVAGGAAGGEYLLVALNASSTAGSRLALEVSGSGLGALAGAAAPAMLPGAPGLSSLPGRWELGRERVEREIWRRQRQQLEPVLEDARREMLLRSLGGVGAVSLPLLVPGDTISFNTSGSCAVADRRMRTARIAAVSQRAVVAVDTTTPPGGFLPTELEQIAQSYDELIHPLTVENFGEPANPFGHESGRVVLFFTPAVNLMSSSAGYVAGFFWPGDLFPRKGEAGRLAPCPASNEREIVYLLVPDPHGRFGGPRHKSEVEAITLSTIAHEVQHVVNTGRRMYVTRTGFEEVWLNEGLSHVAEELLMYESSGLAPRTRIDAERLRQYSGDRDAFLRHQRPNLRRFRLRLARPDSALVSPAAPLESRGASWNFLRYLADHRGGSEAAFWQALVNGSKTGMDNLQQALGRDPMKGLLDWSVSVYADGVVAGLDARWRQPSWDLRSVVPMVEVDQHGGFPLSAPALSSHPESFLLGAGGNAYMRFRVEPGGTGIVHISSGGRPPPSTLRYALVRVE